MSWTKVLLQGDAATLSDSNPVAITENASALPGTASDASRQDHVHASPATWAPSAHDLDAHGSATLSELNAIVSDATLDDSGDPRTPSSHATSHKNGGADEVLLNELGEPTGAVAFNKQQATGLALDVQSSAPADPVNGQVYFNNTDDHPYVYVSA